MKKSTIHYGHCVRLSVWAFVFSCSYWTDWVSVWVGKPSECALSLLVSQKWNKREATHILTGILLYLAPHSINDNNAHWHKTRKDQRQHLQKWMKWFSNFFFSFFIWTNLCFRCRRRKGEIIFNNVICLQFFGVMM